MTVGDLRKKLEGVDDDMEVVVVNDFGDAELRSNYGIGVEQHPIRSPKRPWDYTKNSEPIDVFVIPNEYIHGVA